MARPTPVARGCIPLDLRRDRKLRNCMALPQSTDGPLATCRCAGDGAERSWRGGHVDQHRRPALVRGRARTHSNTYRLDRRKTPPHATPHGNKSRVAAEGRFDEAQRAALTKSSEPEKVDAYIRGVKHPLAKVVEALRKIILSTDPEIGEEIKWNAPTFLYSGDMKPFNPKDYKRHLVVFNLHRKDCIRPFWPGKYAPLKRLNLEAI